MPGRQRDRRSGGRKGIEKRKIARSVGGSDSDSPWLATSCGVAGALLPTVSPYVLAGEGS